MALLLLLPGWRTDKSKSNCCRHSHSQHRNHRSFFLLVLTLSLLGILLFVDDTLLILHHSSSSAGSTSSGSSVRFKKSTLFSKGRDSEHGNRYICEYLLDGTVHANVTTGNAAVALNEPSPPPRRYLDLDCGRHYGSARLGNFLTRWYLTRKIAAEAGLQLTGSCQSASSVFRWMSTTDIDPLETMVIIMMEQQYYAQHQQSDETNHSVPLPPQQQHAWQDTCAICLASDIKAQDMCTFPHGNNHPHIGFSKVVPLIQADMKALGSGVTNEVSSAAVPFLFDDVAIHIRVGDVGSMTSGKYGLVPFRIYAKYIPLGYNRSIGIVTAPFHQRRGRRANNPALNEAVVTSAKKYLERAFPNATISVRNDPKEGHDVVFARLLLAKTLLFCAPSTYCLIPALGRSKDVGETIMVQSSLFGPPRQQGWLSEVEEAGRKYGYNRFRHVSEPLLTSTMLQAMALPDILLKLQEPEDANG